MLTRITAPHFCASFDRSLSIKSFSPILQWMQQKKWTNVQIRNYCQANGWTVEEIVEDVEVDVIDIDVESVEENV